MLWALSILLDYVHAVLKRDGRPAEQVVGHLKRAATRQLRGEELDPFSGSEHSPWAEGCWRVYLNSEADIRRAIAYVENNPIKEGKCPQSWSFVT